jgi:hypothetical protein
VHPSVSKVSRFDRWPLILIGLHAEEGIVGRSYLEPYLKGSVRYLIPAIRDLAEARKGRQVTPLAGPPSIEYDRWIPIDQGVWLHEKCEELGLVRELSNRLLRE